MSGEDGWEILPRERSGVLHLHLLDRCNLHCEHCYMNAAGNGTRSLPLFLVLRCLGDAERLGIRTVYLSGGEPFLYPGLDAILDTLPGRPFQPVVCTNGAGIGRERAQRVKASGASIQISIDGEEAYHDAFRGMAGAFRASARGIHEFVQAGVAVSVVITVCQANRNCLPWLAGWAADHGVERVSVQPLQKLGRGAAIASERLTDDQTCELYLRLSDLGQAYRSRGLRFGLNYRARNYLMEHPCAAYVCNGTGCHRGVAKEIKTLVVREDGTVLPEMPTIDPRFALGNAQEAGLDELVARYFREGYADFHRLCRTVFEDVMPGFESPIVPWDEILSERSWEFGRERAPELYQVMAAPAR